MSAPLQQVRSDNAIPEPHHMSRHANSSLRLVNGVSGEIHQPCERLAWMGHRPDQAVTDSRMLVARHLFGYGRIEH
jgi:hypothetical protein